MPDRKVDDSYSALGEEQREMADIYSRRDAGLDAARYSCFDRAHLFAVQQRERRTLSLLGESGFTDLAGRRILDVGCGSGSWLHHFIHWGADPGHLNGVELLPDRVEAARRGLPAAVDVRCASATCLPFEDGAFDIVLQSTVFSSMPHLATRQRAAREMLRVVNRSGAILWYDLAVDNPGNPDVHGIGSGAIRTLFPECSVKLERITVAPPITRRLIRISPAICHVLSALPFLNVCYLGLIRACDS